MMARRKDIKGIAYGVAGHFSSRYNEIDRYWALGILYSTVVPSKKFELDLMSGESDPSSPYSDLLAQTFRRYLEGQLVNRGLALTHVVEASVTVEFDVEPPKFARPTTWGDPFLCRVVLIDDMGARRVGETKGWCGPHRKNRESRSGRAE